MGRRRTQEDAEFDAAIAERLTEMMDRRGVSVKSLVAKLPEGVPAADERQLRRILNGGQPFNPRLITALANALPCSHGWLLSGVGHPDFDGEPPPLDADFLRSIGAHGLPPLMRQRFIQLGWSVALRHNGNRGDSAMRDYEIICRRLTDWIRGPVDSTYFEEIMHPLSWINYAGRVIDGLETLPVKEKT